MPVLVPSSVPRAHLKTVTHIGTLVATDKGHQGQSYEGDGVSFSVHPAAWETIARLGGLPWWEADASSMALVDGHAFVKNAGQELAIWGLECGWVTPAVEWVVRWFDDESNDTLEMVLPTQEAAQEEAEDLEGSEIVKRNGHAPTAALIERMRHSSKDVGRPKANVLDDVATVWAQDHGFTGIWWNDELNLGRLSAPRGVVFPEHVASVGFALVSPPHAKPRRPRP